MTNPIDLAVEKLRKASEEAGPDWPKPDRIRDDLPILVYRNADKRFIALMDPRVGAAVADLAEQLSAHPGYCAACDWHEEYGPHPTDCPLMRLARLFTEDP